MANILSAIKRVLQWKWWWAVGVVILLAFINAAYQCGRAKDSYSQMKGRYEAYRAVAGADARAMSGRIDELEKGKRDQDAVIAAKEADIARKNNAILNGNKKLATLESEYKNLGDDKDAKIVNLQAQVDELKVQFSLAMATINDKDAQLRAKDIKFDAQVKISDEWKRAYENEQTLRLRSESLTATSEKMQRISLFGSKVKDGAIVGLAIYVIYTLISKK